MMCSPAMKSVSRFITPAKSTATILFHSSLKSERMRISSKGVTDTFMTRRKCCSLKHSDTKDVLLQKHSSAQSSTNRRIFLPGDKVARCLFSPKKSSRNLSDDHFFTPCKNKLNDELPSFDTPHRNLLSLKSLNREVKGFVLGRGSYGLVVKGRYKNKIVAVKIIRKTVCQHEYDSLPREMNALKLKHPNIIETLCVDGQTMGFVIMEYLNHINLEVILQREIIPFKTKSKFLKEVASALEYCHRNNILHLDVKPKNIIVNLHNICKLCDFGSSINITNKNQSVCTAKGTIKYSAPELLRGETATEKADVYSFGITMWQIIYQETPYDKEELHVVVYKVVTQNHRPRNQLQVFNTSVAPIYEACWDDQQSKRPSMFQVITMLQGLTLKI